MKLSVSVRQPWNWPAKNEDILKKYSCFSIYQLLKQWTSKEWKFPQESPSWVPTTPQTTWQHETEARQWCVSGGWDHTFSRLHRCAHPCFSIKTLIPRCWLGRGVGVGSHWSSLLFILSKVATLKSFSLFYFLLLILALLIGLLKWVAKPDLWYRLWPPSSIIAPQCVLHSLPVSPVECSYL